MRAHIIASRVTLRKEITTKKKIIIWVGKFPSLSLKRLEHLTFHKPCHLKKTHPS